MQTNYNDPAVAVAGQLEVASLNDVISLHNLSTQAVSVSVDTVTNSVAYAGVITYSSQAGATYGNTITENPSYTADGSATKTEILAGVKAAIDALASVTTGKLETVLVDAANGPLLVRATKPGFEFTLTVDSKMTASAELGEIPFGSVVVIDAPGKCRLPQVTADISAGDLAVASSSHALESSATGIPRYPTNSALPGVKLGRVWMPTEGAVTAGSQPYARFAASGANQQRGLLRADADSSTATLVPGAKVVIGTSGAGLALVQLKL